MPAASDRAASVEHALMYCCAQAVRVGPMSWKQEVVSLSAHVSAAVPGCKQSSIGSGARLLQRQAACIPQKPGTLLRWALKCVLVVIPIVPYINTGHQLSHGRDLFLRLSYHRLLHESTTR